MASKVKIEAFEKIDKARIKGKIGHTRTGACTSQGRCYHGPKPRLVAKPGRTAIKSKKKAGKL